MIKLFFKYVMIACVLVPLWTMINFTVACIVLDIFSYVDSYLNVQMFSITLAVIETSVILIYYNKK